MFKKGDKVSYISYGEKRTGVVMLDQKQGSTIVWIIDDESGLRRFQFLDSLSKLS